jgi:hypothetical protein
MRLETERRWLKVACAVTAAVGVGMAALSLPGAAGATTGLTDVLFAEGGDMTSPLSRLLTAIVGGVLAGWAVTMWMVVDRVHERDPASARAILRPGLAVWFVVDSIGSVVSGGALNVVGNLGFVVLFGVPLVWAPRRRSATPRAAAA